MRLIDTDTLIEQWEADAEQMEDFVFKMATYAAINDVKKAPTVDAEPVRHGRWIPKKIIIDGWRYDSGMKCSVCGEDALNAEDDEFLTDYCPCCGAKMDGERREE